MLNAIEASGVKLGSRMELFYPVDATSVSSFDMNVVKNNKIYTSALLSLFGHDRKFLEKLLPPSKLEFVQKSTATLGRIMPSNPMTQTP